MAGPPREDRVHLIDQSVSQLLDNYPSIHRLASRSLATRRMQDAHQLILTTLKLPGGADMTEANDRRILRLNAEPGAFPELPPWLGALQARITR